MRLLHIPWREWSMNWTIAKFAAA
ncbi:MAG: hypothetical protein QOD34_3360, partial [Mycobacterium sp.]|nr:hypothetical protein [Mycobacterium sp.]